MISGFRACCPSHANVRLPWHSLMTRHTSSVSMYRRHSDPARGPRPASPRRIRSVMTASTVWLNGVRLGEYRGGFTPFGFDLTEHVICW